MVMKKIIILVLGLIITQIALSQYVIVVFKPTDPDPFVHQFNPVDSLCDPEMYGTLQWAVRYLNYIGGNAEIVFDIPGTGVHEIMLNYDLPMIRGNVVIDATTQPGYSYGNPVIKINGGNLLSNCFQSYTCQVTVMGFHITGFLYHGIVLNNASNSFAIENVITNVGNGIADYTAAIGIRTISSENISLYGNIIGTSNESGTITGIEDFGMLIQSCQNSIIGGTGFQQANTIVNCGIRGVSIFSSTGVKLSGNRIYNNPEAIFLSYGSNNNKAAPVITSYDGTTVTGTSEPVDIIEIFGSADSENANEYLTTVTADANGEWTASVSTIYLGIIATATDAGNNTSTLSSYYVIPQQPGFSCESAIDLGKGDTIVYNIAVNDSILWFEFEPVYSNVTITVSSSSGNLNYMDIYGGLCNNFNYFESISSSHDSIVFVSDSLSPAQKYFIKVSGNISINISIKNTLTLFGFHTLFLCPNGTVYATGRNNYGQLGDYTNIEKHLPVQVLSDVIEVSGGYQFSLALKSDGSVWTWGHNDYGQLGIGSTGGSINHPIIVNIPTTITAISAGSFHCMALDVNNNVWVWGRNSEGQLGIGSNSNINTPTMANISGVIAISGGMLHSLFVKSNGTVMASGGNLYGQLGTGNINGSNNPVTCININSVIKVSCGGVHSLALKSNGTVWSWGYNHDGQLGNSTNNTSLIPIQVNVLTGITDISSGDIFNLALKNVGLNGTVYAWGDNSYGQIGDGTYTDSYNPKLVYSLTGVTGIFAGSTSSFATLSNCSVWAWGDNYSGQLGDGSTTERTNPVPIPFSCGPVITDASPQNITICIGASTNLFVTVDGGSQPYTYVWSPSVGLNNPNIANPIATPAATTTYNVIVTDANGCSCVSQTTISVIPSALSANFTYEGFCQSNLFYFTDASSPSGYSYTYQWDIDNNGTIDYYIQNPSHLFTIPGYHPVKLTVTNACGVNNSIIKYVYVAPQDDSRGINVDCCVENFDWIPYVIIGTGVTNWDTPGDIKRIKGTLYIGYNCTLNISNGVIVSFGPQGKIDIAPGGILNVSGNSILTGTCIETPSKDPSCPPPCFCKNMWEGIRVRGTNGVGHIPFDQTETGQLIINNATIQDAHIAILVGRISFPDIGGTPSNPYWIGGRNGYINVSNCKFVNNGINIKFLPFVPSPGSSYSGRKNRSMIRHCEFYTTYQLLDAGYVYPNTQYYYPNQFNPCYSSNSTGRSCVGIEILGQILTFGLNYNNFYNVEKAIESNDASYNVSYSSFNKVARSIYILTDHPSLFTTGHRILNNNFWISSNNAIEITSGRYDYIKDNTFGDPIYQQALNPRSILLNSTNDFTINDNTFNKVEQAILSNGLSLGSNLIGYSSTGNFFNQTNINIFGYGNNSFLQTKCNNSTNDSYVPTDYSGFNWAIIGAIADQGLPFDAGLTPIEQTKLPTGNLFSPTSLNQIESASFTPFTYYQHNDPPERMASQSFSPQINIDTEPIAFDESNPDNSCLSSNNNDDQTMLKLAYSQELLNIQQYQSQYNSILSQVDKGQTNYLLSIINPMAPGKLKNTLLSHFPLSDTVIIATVFRNNPLASGLLKEILVSNCPVSNNVWKQICNAVDDLPPGIASQIKKAQGYNPTVTTLTTLQRQIDEHTSNLKQAVQKITLNYINTDSVETAINFLKTVPFAEYSMLVISSLAEDSLTLAEASSRLQSFVPSNEAEQDWKLIESIYIDLRQEGKSVFDMDSVQLSRIWEIALKEDHNIAVGNARSILYHLYGTEFPFDYQPVFNTLRRANIETNNTEKTDEQYLIYPNPSSGNITVYSKGLFSEGETIKIMDVTGKIVQQDKLPENVSEYNITISLSNGVYLCRIFNGESQVFEKQLIIQK